MALPELVALPEFKAALAGSAGAGARTAANLPDDRLAAALDESHAEVLGKIGTRYALPTTPEATPELVRGIILAVAAYVATLEWLQGKDLSDRDAVVLRYRRAMGQLKEITDGVLVLELESPTGGGTFEAEAYNAIPSLGLAGDVNAPTYGGLVSGDWQGGGRAWV